MRTFMIDYSYTNMRIRSCFRKIPIYCAYLLQMTKGYMHYSSSHERKMPQIASLASFLLSRLHGMRCCWGSERMMG